MNEMKFQKGRGVQVKRINLRKTPKLFNSASKKGFINN
jgi:hypothetical protein